MYVPPSFAETDPAVLHAIVERHSFALLVSPTGYEAAGTVPAWNGAALHRSGRTLEDDRG